MRKKKKYRLKKWVKVTLWIILFLIIAIVAIKIITKFTKKEDTNSLDISVLRKLYNNNDITARIIIENLNLDAIVTKTNDNDYYLKHDINKYKNEEGNPYIDYRNNLDLAHEKQINIYSHNVENKQYQEYYPFSKLENLLKEDTFNKNNEILIYTDNRVLKYQIYAIKKITSIDNEHMIIKTNNALELENHYKKLLTNTTYCKNNCKLDIEDDILVLQTCLYEYEDEYLIVIAKKI